MARGRMISKSLSTSEKFASLTTIAGELAEFCQTLYPLLVAHSDDFGKLQGDTFTVKFVCFPISPRPVQEFAVALAHLHAAGLIIRYEIESKAYIQIENFEQHQQGLHKRTKSIFPDVPGVSGKSPVNELKELELEGTRRKEEKDKNSGVPPHSVQFPDRKPSENVKIITKLAHEVLKSHNGHDVSGADLCDEIKTLCAKRKIAYDAMVIRKALDSADVQRRAAS